MEHVKKRSANKDASVTKRSARSKDPLEAPFHLATPSSNELYNALPLNHERHEIRILELQSANPLQGELKVVSLQHKTVAGYKALSYTWGAESSGDKIILNSKHELFITRNLFKALRRLRQFHDNRALWVDAICINQTSDRERGQQVAFMHEIYRKAINVLIWLGEPTEEYLTYQPVLWDWRRRWDTILSALAQTEPRWHERAWVVQEFVHARKIYINVGWFSWKYDQEEFSEIETKIGLYFKNQVAEHTSQTLFSSMTKRFALLETIRARVRTTESSHVFDLFELQVIHHGTPRSHATDPRDDVYSILSLIDPRESEIIGSDYSLTWQEVYAKATFASIVVRGDLDMLQYKDVSTSYRYMTDVDSVPSLPTWAVDFTTLDLSTNYNRTELATKLDFESRQLGQQQSYVTLMPDNLSLQIRAWPLGFMDADTVAIDQLHFDVNFDREDMEPLLSVLANTLRALQEASRSNSEAALAHWSASERKLAAVIGKMYLERNVKLPSRLSGRYNETFKMERCLHEQHVAQALLECWDSAVGLRPVSRPDPDPETERHVDSDLACLTEYTSRITNGCSIFVTATGLIGVAPGSSNGGVRRGDLVALVPNTRYPLVLRDGGNHWSFHGLCYARGITDGKLLGSLSFPEGDLREFVLR